MLLFTLFSLASASLARVKEISEVAPLIINQGPTSRCFKWYAEPATAGAPTDQEASSCYGDNMYGLFTMATYDWKIENYKKSPGYNGVVKGANNSPLTVALTNNAKNYNCTGVEVNLSYDYPSSSLYANVSTTDLSTYDEVIIEYDIYVKSATVEKSDCSCLQEGKATCPSWWKTQFTTDILFYQGKKDPQDFNVISIRHFDPQKNGKTYFNAAGGHRYQYSDNLVAPTPGTKQHVKLDAKHLIASYSSELCQGATLNGPIYLRSIQFVSIATGGNMEVEITNVKANAFKFKPGTFTSSTVSAGCTPTNCAIQPTNTKFACAL